MSLKFSLLLFVAVFCFCNGIRRLEMYSAMDHIHFDLNGENVIGEKDVYFVLTEMTCPKTARFFIRGSYDPNDDYQEELLKELKKKYPFDYEKCKFHLLGGGKVKKERKKIIVSGASGKFGPSNAKLVAHLLKHCSGNDYKGLQFITE